MGIGVTGYLQATDEQKGWLSNCYEYLREFDRNYSRKHGFPPSIKIDLARRHKYPVEYVRNFDGTNDITTMVISFPYSLPEGTIFAKNCSAIEQMEWVKKLQTEWSDNSVSVTVYYKKEELPEIKEWLRKNYNNSIKTISFLLFSEHGFEQAPFEEMCVLSC
jgi:hypothetical protein